MKKSISIVLLATILLQSCVAYHDTSVSLNEAKDKGRVRVSYTDGRDASFGNIIFKDSTYYGIPVPKHISEKPLDSINIRAIYLKDIKKSKTQSVIFGVTSATIFILLIGALILAGLALQDLANQ